MVREPSIAITISIVEENWNATSRPPVGKLWNRGTRKIIGGLSPPEDHLIEGLNPLVGGKTS